MSQSIEPPPVRESAPEAPPQLPPKAANLWQRIWGGFVAATLAIWKFALPLFKLAKGAKILLTAGSMALSVWFYSTVYGFWFALGFVVCILIHEMGHVFAAWRLGLPVSAPIFIPGMGALILTKRAARSAWEGALIGIGGPAFGALAAVACWAIYATTGNGLFLGLALIGFIINLFNMMPMFPLDGGWITGAISPYIWVLGMIGMIAMLFLGWAHNPLLWILLIMSLPQVWSALRRGTADPEGVHTTVKQRVTMGTAYVGLCGFLLWGVNVTHDGTTALRHAQEPSTAMIAR